MHTKWKVPLDNLQHKKIKIDTAGDHTIICDDTDKLSYEIVLQPLQGESADVTLWITGASKDATILIVADNYHTKVNLQICVKAEDAQKHVLRIYQNHTVANTQSNCTIKGIAYDTSIIDYEGLITLEGGSENSHAHQTSNFLIMSDVATVRSVPSLQAHHNNLECGHATTISYVDPLVVWYAAQRGVPVATIEQLIEKNFLPYI